MKGTARFMGMAGAFGALGGDLSTLSQNPGGIGVYRNSEVGITFDLDCQSSRSKTNLGSFDNDRTKFMVNNVGGVWTLKLNSTAVPNINIGISYNKAASFSRKYKGNIGLGNSISNYIAALSNANGVAEGEVSIDNGNPYNSNAPWISTLGFQGYLMTPYFPDPNSDLTEWYGQWVNGKTSGIGHFDVTESGGVDEYNIAVGGNINNIVFWGMDFGITSLSFKETSEWGEDLTNAWVNGMMVDNNTFRYGNRYSAWGSGFNYKFGVIVKPIQELRIGFAVHTPTWYNMTESYIGGIQFNNPDRNWQFQTVETNNGERGSDSFNFRSPMKLIASVAGVIGGRFILSADYEWQPYTQMRFSAPSGYDGWYDDEWYDDYWDGIWMKPSPLAPETRSGVFEAGDPFYNSNKEIKSYYRAQNSLRIGAEYRVTSRFSVRAGYSFVSAPTSVKAYNNETEIYTSGTLTNYRFNDVTNYITCGLGYKISHFYADLAYVYKHLTGTFHPYPADAYGSSMTTPKAELGLSDHQILLSLGFKF